MKFKPGQLVTHGDDWTFGVGQENKYIVLQVIKVKQPFGPTDYSENPSLKLFCFQGHNYGQTMFISSEGMKEWK